MEKLIKFRLLSDSLSNDEFEIFITQLFNQFDKRTLILRSLVYIFHAQIHKQDQKTEQMQSKNQDQNHDEQHVPNKDLITTINIISKIIQSRKSNKSLTTNNHHKAATSIWNQNDREQKDYFISIQTSSPNTHSDKTATNSKKVSFPDLPTALIGHCASYLTFYEHQNFQQTSRQIFIGCKIPFPFNISPVRYFENVWYPNNTQN